MDALKILIIGMGEIGTALNEVILTHLSDHPPKTKIAVSTRDLDSSSELPPKFDVLHVCIPYSDGFVQQVNDYQQFYQAGMVVIHSTVPPGTTRKCEHAVHAPIRGRHKMLAEGIRKYEIFIGVPADPGQHIQTLLAYFNKIFPCSIKVVSPEATELGKLLSLTQYAFNIEFWRYAQKCCTKYNISDSAIRSFISSRNRGVSQLEKSNSLSLPLMYPPQGKIGGHCVLPAVELLNSVVKDMLLQDVLDLNKAFDVKSYPNEAELTYKVWPPCNIYKSAKIGAGCSIGAFSEIGDHVRIGINTRIGAYCFIPEGVTIGNRCFIAPRVTFTNDRYPPSKREQWADTFVHNNVVIGAGAIILPGIELGEGCKIAAGSVVTENVTAGATVRGNHSAKEVESKW